MPHDNRLSKKLISLCCLLYFTSYITRLNYAAAISEIIISMDITKSMASLAVTGSFITYGLGQLVSGPLGDKRAPEKLIFTGILATAIDNLLIATAGNIQTMTILWCFNGFFQAMIWPPLLRIMAENLSPEAYRSACVKVNTAASLGTIGVYILVPICIRLGGWRLAFLFPSIFAMGVALIWRHIAKKILVHKNTPAAGHVSRGIRMNMPKTTETSEDVSQPSPNVGRLILLSGAISVFFAVIFQGTLRDGLTTWMPSYIDDIYHLGTSGAILTTAILPLFSIISIAMASLLNEHMKSELFTSSLLFGISLVSAVTLRLFFNANAILSVALMALITGCMHGTNMLLISRLPAYFEPFGCVSTMSGIFNTFPYVGSALSTFGIAALSEHFGWPLTIVCWSFIALFGLIACLIASRRWHRFFNYNLSR